MSTLAVTGADLDGVVVGLRAVDGVIVELGPDVVSRQGDELLDATGRALVPGLVNGHTHAAMTLFRGYGGDLPLMEWLERMIWPAEAELTDDDVYWGTRLACLEMVQSGTVRFWDMYWHPAAVARAVDDAGLRATVGLPLIDGLDAARGRALRVEALRSLDEAAGISPRVDVSLAPHGLYTVSTESLEWIAEASADRETAVQLHFLEVEDEVTGLRDRTGEAPAAYLDRLGLLTPRVVLAHAVWVTDDDLDLIAERGSVVVTSPVSNMKLAVGGVFPFGEVRRRGIPVGIGTDGAASNNALDLFQEVKVLSLLQKHSQGDVTALGAEEAWAVATGALAPTLGGTPRVAVGDRADFLLVRRDAPELAPGHLHANLVYSASGAVVNATVVDGCVLMRDGTVPEAEEVVAKAREAATRLGAL